LAITGNLFAESDEAVPESKPEIVVDLDATTTSLLKAVGFLSRLKSNVSFHEILDCRHPWVYTTYRFLEY
jgi:hypothetical protein